MVQANGGSYMEGIQLAIQAVLVSPHFLFRWELDPELEKPAQVRVLNDYELASRLSYFLWSSIPDDHLLALAREGALTRPGVLESEVQRMLKDPKSHALVSNFGGQWLQIRNLKEATPDRELIKKLSIVFSIHILQPRKSEKARAWDWRLFSAL